MKENKSTPAGTVLMCGNWQNNVPPLLIIQKEAGKEMLSFIGWDNHSVLSNRVEQGGWMLGYHVRDARGFLDHAVVTHILPIINCKATPVSLDWPAIENIRLQRQFYELKEQIAAKDPAAGERLMILGWFHTHPNTLDVFLSSTDFENIRKYFNEPDQFSIVLNPQRLVWKAYRGVSGQKCNAVVILDAPQVHSTSRKNKKHTKSRKSKKMKYLQKKQRKGQKRRRKHR